MTQQKLSKRSASLRSISLALIFMHKVLKIIFIDKLESMYALTDFAKSKFIFRINATNALAGCNERPSGNLSLLHLRKHCIYA